MATRRNIEIRLPNLDRYYRDSERFTEAFMSIHAAGGGGVVSVSASISYHGGGFTTMRIGTDFYASQRIRARGTQKTIDTLFAQWTTPERQAELIAQAEAHYARKAEAA